MKKSIAILLALVTLCLCVGLTACNRDDKNITGVTLKSQTVDYDGEKHSLKVQGDLPKGAQVAYAYNLFNDPTVVTDGVKDVGSYMVKATITCQGYKKLELSATLRIRGQQFAENISMPNSSPKWSGSKKSLTVTGTLPEGTQVTYYYNGVQTDGVKDVGEYEVKAVLTCAGYEPKTITRTLIIVPLQFKDYLGVDEITLESDTVVYDGELHKLELNVTKSFPGQTGINVTYNGQQAAEGVSEVGNYEVKWVITCKGYETLTLTGTLTITSAPQGE